MNPTGTPTSQSKNPKAKKNLSGGPITRKPVQKNKSMVPAKRTMMNRGQGTRHVPGKLSIPRKLASGHYPLYGEKS